MLSKFARTSCAVMTLLAVTAANAQVAKRPTDVGPNAVPLNTKPVADIVEPKFFPPASCIVTVLPQNGGTSTNGARALHRFAASCAGLADHRNRNGCRRLHWRHRAELHRI